MHYTDCSDPAALIADVVVRKLRVNRDPRGTLTETLRTDWTDVFDAATRPFAQCYCSQTWRGVARDEDRWHAHEHQEDRFVVIGGELVLALYDARATSVTYRRLNLIRLGESGGDDGQYLVVIPRRVLHAFLATGQSGVVLLNFPTRLYNPDDEARIPFSAVNARLPDGSPFSWNVVRADLGLTSPTLRP